MKPHKIVALTLLLLSFTFLTTITASAKDEWIQVRSKNFYLIGNASEKDIRKVATRLEQFRETFRQVFKSVNLTASIPTNVVVFKSESAYKPFKPKRAGGKIDNFGAGYFQPGEDVNYITLSTEGEDADTFGTIFHEYVHFIVNTNFGKSEVPPWCNEGLAEYYQTFAIEEDQKVKLGLPQSGHLALLAQNKLIPLDTLFKISNYALHQNGNHSRSIFYAESWALIHYLVQSGKSEGLGKFLSAVMKDTPPETAFQEAFQIGYADMEKDLRKYVAKSSYQYNILTFKNKLVFDAEMRVAPLDEADSDSYLGDLLYHTDRADDAEPILKAALAQKPDSTRANTTLGMVKLRQRKFDEAKTYLEKALSVDQKNHIALYRYAFLLSREGRDEFGYVRGFDKDLAAKMRELLKKAIALNPAFTESYELLAFVNLVDNEDLDESVTLLKTALRYQPGNQRYAIRIAEILSRQNKFADAAAIAEKIARTADDPEVKSQAENLQQQLNQQKEYFDRAAEARKKYDEMAADPSRAAAPRLTKPVAEREPSPEEIKRREEELKMRAINRELRKPADGERQVLGNIQRVECKGKAISFVVKTDTESLSLTSKDFQNLILTSFAPEADTVQFGCGAKVDAIRMVLTYKPAADPKAVARGELIAVDLVPTNFHFIDPATAKSWETEEAAAEPALPPQPPPSRPTGRTEQPDLDAVRRDAMMSAVKNAMRKPAEGETRLLGTIERSECTNKGMFFYLRSGDQVLKLTNTSGQSLYLKGFTPEIENLRFGCGMKPVDVPVVFTYKPVADPKSKTSGDLVALEFVPKSSVLE
ncbi:MAG TPA: tetratricopeptide repeat protein [Pyrinomonadaceae bacterium]|nr:tetratricopeptide repeat protein [Pyrinomonadaceae bacterium]